MRKGLVLWLIGRFLSNTKEMQIACEYREMYLAVFQRIGWGMTEMRHGGEAFAD